MLAPYLLGRRGPGAYTGSSGDGDGGFVEPPIVTTTSSGDTTVKGQVKPGSFGKFVYPLATLTAGRQYTFRYTPQFSQLAQQGKLAMVGFGLKNGNDFHIVGLRGDGSTGLHKYKVYGTPPNGWNKDSGHTTSDGGASANGTQAGPNYIRLTVSSDGTTYTFSTSPDNVTYTDEYTAAVPTPFSNVSGVATFGIALWFNNADAGPFSIVIDQFADVVPATWQITAQASPAGDNGGWNGYTLRMRVAPAGLAHGGGSKVRVTWKASSSSGFTIDSAYIGAGASAGDAYDFETTPTQLKFGGNAGATVLTGALLLSDETTYAVDASKPLIVSIHFSAASAVGAQLSVANWQGYYKSGVSEAGTVNVSGYSTGGINTDYGLAKIESYV